MLTKIGETLTAVCRQQRGSRHPPPGTGSTVEPIRGNLPTSYRNPMATYGPELHNSETVPDGDAR